MSLTWDAKDLEQGDNAIVFIAVMRQNLNLNKFAKNAFVGDEILDISVIFGFKLAIKNPVFIPTRKHIAHWNTNVFWRTGEKLKVG